MMTDRPFARAKSTAARIRGDGDDDAIEHLDRSFHQVFMAQRDRVERSRIHRCYRHPPSSVLLITAVAGEYRTLPAPD